MAIPAVRHSPVPTRHLAAIPDPDAGGEALLPANVVGAYQVAQAAADRGVRRLVLASSSQAVSAYPEGTQVRTAEAPGPANLYGATKAWAEALGAWVAWTTSSSVVALGIGYFAARPLTADGATPGNLAAWLDVGLGALGRRRVAATPKSAGRTQWRWEGR